MRAEALKWWIGLTEAEKVELLNTYRPYKFFNDEYTAPLIMVIGSCKIEEMYKQTLTTSNPSI